MRIDCALLCDAATVREGLLNILGGGVSRAARTDFPAPLSMTLAVRMVFEPHELAARHRLEVRLIDVESDRQQLVELRLEFGFDPPPELEPGEEAAVAIPVDLRSFSLPHPGEYLFDILLDGERQASVPLRGTEEQLAPSAAAGA